MRKVSLYAFTSCLILGSAVASFAANKPATATPAAIKAAPAAASSTAPSTTSTTTEKKPVTSKKHRHHTARATPKATPKPGTPGN